MLDRELEAQQLAAITSEFDKFVNKIKLHENDPQLALFLSVFSKGKFLRKERYTEFSQFGYVLEAGVLKVTCGEQTVLYDVKSICSVISANGVNGIIIVFKHGIVEMRLIANPVLANLY